MTDFYRTLAEPCGPLETKEKGSRFLAFASPAATMEDAERFVATLMTLLISDGPVVRETAKSMPSVTVTGANRRERQARRSIKK